MILALVIVPLALVGTVLAIAALRPSHACYSRAATIDAPAARIFPLINQLGAWPRWSPFERDPQVRRGYSGPDAGVGAQYTWDGNSHIGRGRMLVVESLENSRVRMQLDFERPFRARSHATFSLEPQGSATRVTWSMEGPQPFVCRLMGVFVNMERMCGRDFETGLASLAREAGGGAVRTGGASPAPHAAPVAG